MLQEVIVIKEELIKIFQTVFNRQDIQIHEEMVADDIDEWDSLTHIQLIVEVEKKFNVKFRNAEIARLKNVGDLIKLISKYTS